MTIVSPIWFFAGLALGGLHVSSLWLSMQRTPALTVATSPLRLLLVAISLVVAAISGGILPASLGWVAGYLTGTVFVLARGKSA